MAVLTGLLPRQVEEQAVGVLRLNSLETIEDVGAEPSKAKPWPGFLVGLS